MKYDVFLSYRRKGGFETAKHLFDLLTKDGYKVCLDLTTLREGDFDKALLSRIDECQDFILIVDSNAFERCINPDYDPKNDWLRQELAYALKQGKNIIPVLLAGASFPDNLPPDISQIVYKHGPSYSLEYYDSFYGKLKDFMHTKKVQTKKILFFSIIAAVVLIGALSFLVFSKKQSDSNVMPQVPSAEVPKQTTATESEPAPVVEPVKKIEMEVPDKTEVKPSPVVSAPQSNPASIAKPENKQSVSSNSVTVAAERYIQTVSGSAAGYDYVDLGLSVMWATCNVGASKPSESGQFFAWGETKSKSEYVWTTYSFLLDGTNKDNARFTKYNFDSKSGNVDGLYKLEATNDVAGVMWAGGWRMPTKEEFDELVSECTWKWTKVEGVDGYLVYSKKAGFEKNSIFLPAAGFYQKKSVLNRGSRGCYWSASIGTYSHSACFLGFNSSLTRTYNEERYIGRTVRPVYKK
jgi:uncharacterized protein (TIGR02145 family)